MATNEDLEIYKEAEIYLKEKRSELKRKWGIDFVPEEETPEGKGRGAERAFSIRNFGMNTWSDLFNSRQKLALITLVQKTKETYKEMIRREYNKEYAKALISYLVILNNGIIDHNSKLCQWRGGTEDGGHTFGRQVLPMCWDYFEINFQSGSTGSFQSGMKRLLRVIDHLSTINSTPSTIIQISATSIPFPENFFDAVFTDPPYYDNVPYSYLSDFFYVWLKRSIGHLYPDLFSTPLTPKSKEIVAYTHNKSWENGKQFFEDMLIKSFQEINRVLKPDGIATIVYAHKTTEGWETVINALLDSGLVITASWPINTEMQARLRAKESAALASSIYIVARKMKREEIGWFNEVKEEIKRYLNEKMEKLWDEGISGADYFIAAIGSAIEVFGKYKKISDYEGNEIRANRLLDFVRNEVTDYAVKQILHNGIDEELSALTKFYLLWRWTFQERKAHFDEARKLAQSTGIDLSKEWDKGFIEKKKEFISVLGPQERDVNKLEDSKELIDILHLALKLWKEGNREKMKEILQNSKFGMEDYFYRVAQAISETLPSQSAEKKLLEGFLSGKERLIKEVKVKSVQKRLFE
jgi:adenine-specific DNA methylase